MCVDEQISIREAESGEGGGRRVLTLLVLRSCTLMHLRKNTKEKGGGGGLKGEQSVC